MSEVRTFGYSTPGQLTLYDAMIDDNGTLRTRHYVAPDLDTAFTMAQHRVRKGQHVVGVQYRMEVDSVCFEITELLADHDRRSA